jgi:thiamine-phosphate pyrophosphorylase
MQSKIPKIYYFIDEFNLSDLHKLGKNINLIYRNYQKKISHKELLSIKKFCELTKRKFFISNNIKLALNLKLNGIYIPSFNNKINYLSSFSFEKKFEIIGSAHNYAEIQIKKKQGCSEVFLSPIFSVKKNKNYLNIYNFNKLTVNKKINFIALGGINEKNYKKIRLTKSLGFAGISWIKKNGLRKLRPF